MKARVKPGYCAERQSLKDIVPLDTPFTLFISPSQRCNFRCSFCSHSLPESRKREAGFASRDLDMRTFHTIAEQSKHFSSKYKRILLTGLGEPLLNHNIAEMVAILRDCDIAEQLEIFTNASLLTEKLSEELIRSGLTRLRISVQGTNAQKYLTHCGVKINFEKLVDGIRFFYEKSRGKCSIYCKIINEQLENDEDRERFFSLFGDMSDDIFVENLVRAQPMMGDYDNEIPLSRTFYGEASNKREVCPYLFYSLQTDSEGNCYPCPPLSLPLSFSLGNVHEIPLTAIWNGKNHTELMLSHLRKDGSKCDLCRKCTNYLCFTPEEDNLDTSAAAIMAQILNRRCSPEVGHG